MFLSGSHHFVRFLFCSRTKKLFERLWSSVASWQNGVAKTPMSQKYAFVRLFSFLALVEYHFLLFVGITLLNFFMQELYEYFSSCANTSSSKAKRTTHVPELSSASLQFLADLLQKNPESGHALLKTLIAEDNTNFERNNIVLHNIYLQILHTLLMEITNSSVDVSQVAAGNALSGTSHCVTENHEATLRFYCVLSFFDPPKEIKGPALANFLEDLCKLCSVPNGPLKLEYIFSSLLGKSSQFLLKEFCEVYWQVRMKASEQSSAASDLLTDAGKTLLGFCNQIQDGSITHYPWKDLYLMCLSQGRHFLDMFIVSDALKN